MVAWLCWHKGCRLWDLRVVGFMGRLMLIVDFVVVVVVVGVWNRDREVVGYVSWGFGGCTVVEISLYGVDQLGMVGESRDWLAQCGGSVGLV